MADPRGIPEFDMAVETLASPSKYSKAQLAQACLIAGMCRAAFGSVRFVYAQQPDD